MVMVAYSILFVVKTICFGRFQLFCYFLKISKSLRRSGDVGRMRQYYDVADDG